ncbi:acyltransferase [Eubacterium maltosivorans]|uniref:acyltransferase n=1 Tax=Eubacterium maltosivorans TaxID=2041044 RepID=UPI00189EFDEF|nr:acyltransferase [Eubacterium maltosivorans]
MRKKRSFKEVFKKLNQISILKFIKFNFLTANIERKKGAYIIPFKGAALEIDKKAKIILDGTIHMGINQVKGSKEGTYIRLAANSRWEVKEDVLLFFGTFVDIHEDSLLETEFFSANTGSVIVVGKHIKMGHDVMIGRNVIIYDSDFHSIIDERQKPINFSKSVTIEDHVWLTNNIMVLKGVTIGKDSLISAMTLVRKDVPSHSLVAGIPGKIIKDNIKWSREYIHEFEKQFW